MNIIITKEKLMNGWVNGRLHIHVIDAFREACAKHDLTAHNDVTRFYCGDGTGEEITIRDLYMNMHDFLKAGYKFVDGDQYIDMMHIITIRGKRLSCEELPTSIANELCDYDVNRFVINARALK